ncbi:MAG: hypothetical protein ACRD1H_11590 [Vicinamibacterales bacterium]
MKLQQAKGLFFDRRAVTGAADKGTRKVLSKFGAFVRQSARSSIRKRKSISQPGQPPSSHTGLLKRNIVFVFSPETRSVVIGPILLNKNTDAPRLLEHGDSVVGRKRKRRVRMTYRARPFMGPAFDREQQKLPALWRNSVK